MIAIVTETLSCLNESDCASFGVSLCPLSCVWGEDTLPDRILSTAEGIPDGEARSEPPTEEMYRTRFGSLLATHDGVLCITASHIFSQSHRNATRAAAEFGGRVVIFDSYSVAGGQFLLVFRARHLITLGYPMSRIKGELEAYRNTLRVSFTSRSAYVLERAGKLSFRMPAAGPTSDEQPVFHIRRGGIRVATYAVGARGIMDEMLAVLETDGARKPPSHVVVHYTDRTEAVEYLLHRIETLYPSATVYERPITLSLQVSLGSHIVGLIGD